MANIDQHPNGSFCWIELATSDQAAAKNFYGSIFGWTPNDMPMGPNDFYTIFRIDGRDAAAGSLTRSPAQLIGNTRIKFGLIRCLRQFVPIL